MEARRSDSGTISSSATASMNPAPSAMKYFRYSRDHCRRMTKNPPTRSAPPASTPSDSANAIRAAVARNGASTRMAEKDNVAVLHNVISALQAHLRTFASRSPTSRRQQFFPTNYFRLDEMRFDVAVNRARRFHGGSSARNRPRAAFGLAACQKRNQAQQFVACAEQRSEEHTSELQSRPH